MKNQINFQMQKKDGRRRRRENETLIDNSTLYKHKTAFFLMYEVLAPSREAISETRSWARSWVTIFAKHEIARPTSYWFEELKSFLKRLVVNKATSVFSSKLWEAARYPTRLWANFGDDITSTMWKAAHDMLYPKVWSYLFLLFDCDWSNWSLPIKRKKKERRKKKKKNWLT